MVTRLTNYTKQFWILLSTDDMDTLGAHNGDEAIVIDQDKRYVFDEDYQTWHQIPMSGGGGGSGDNRFIVTLTPTAPDYSGTMNKTTGQIRAAYNAGKEIWFTLGTQAAPVSFVDEFGTAQAGFYAYVILTANNLLAILQADNADTESTYTTTTYQLTPLTT